MHNPNWGWLAKGPDAWMRTAAEAAVDLVIAGHRHRLSYTPPGPNVDHTYHLLVLGQEQIARVSATTEQLGVTVTGLDGAVKQTIAIPRQR